MGNQLPGACVEHRESKYSPGVNEQLRSVLVAEDHFESPRLGIERARELVGDVKAGITAFFDRRPYAKVVDFDDETGQQVHKVRTARLPGRIRTLVKDAAENLRSALDHAVYGSARALGVDDPRHTGFPFAETPAGVLGELGKERLKGNPPGTRAFLVGFEPHANGNQVLWGLNRLRAPNTHRILSPVLLNAVGTSVGLAPLRMPGGGGQLGYSKWDKLKSEVEFMRLPHGSTYKYEVR